MDYKIYKIPDPAHFTDTSQPFNKSIADLLLAFDYTPKAKEGISKMVTVPADNEAGYKVVACQSFFREVGNAAYVFLPGTECIYRFQEAILPIRNKTKCFLKAGFKGLIFGAEETGLLERRFDKCSDEIDAFEGELLKLSIQNISQDDWYHFTGTAENILEKLRKRCALALR